MPHLLHGSLAGSKSGPTTFQAARTFQLAGVESFVLRQLTTLLVASAILLGNISDSSQAFAAYQSQTQPSTVAKNEPPLKPAGAAGIRQAQGIEDVDVWFFSGLILAAIVWVLFYNDDDDSSDSTGSTA